MKISARSVLMSGIAALTASAIAVTPIHAPPPDITVAANPAAERPVLSQELVDLLAAVQRISPNLTAAGPGAASAEPGVGVQSVASDAILNAWNAVLPWIDYGVNVADGVLGWIPGLAIVGDQISIVYYSLVRPVANSFVVNLVVPVVNAPLDINSYVNGLATLGSVTVNSLINLGINEFNYFFGWLIPPIFAAASATGPTAVTADGITAPDVELTNAASDLVEAIYIPMRNGVDYFAGFPLIPTATAQTREMDSAAEISRVPSIVETPLSEITATVRSVRNDVRTELTERRTTAEDDAAATTGVVRAQGEVRGALAKAASDVTNTLRSDKPSKAADGATKASTNVVKSIGDTAGNVVKRVREAVQDARDAVKNPPAADAGD